MLTKLLHHLRTTPPRRRIRRLDSQVMETLEDRLMLTSFDPATGKLVFTGTSGDDTIVVDFDILSEDTFDVYLNGSVSRYEDVTAVTLQGGSGNDNITVTYSRQNQQGPLNGTPPKWRVEGGLGDDIIDFPANGKATLVGNDGNDNVSGSEFDDTLHGGNGNDTLHGQDGDDRILGRGQDDELRGGFGNDTILGAGGKDTILGGAGNDSLMGEAADDSIQAGSGSDTIFGGTGADNINGSNGHDWIDAGAGLDVARGGNGDDTLFGGDGTDVVIGDDGADLIYAGTVSSDTVYDNLFGGRAEFDGITWNPTVDNSASDTLGQPSVGDDIVGIEFF